MEPQGAMANDICRPDKRRPHGEIGLGYTPIRPKIEVGFWWAKWLFDNVFFQSTDVGELIVLPLLLAH